MHTVRLPTVHVSVSTTRCQYHLRVGPQVNKFEQVSSDVHSSDVWGGVPYLSHVMYLPLSRDQTDSRKKHYLHATSFAGGENSSLCLTVPFPIPVFKNQWDQKRALFISDIILVFADWTGWKSIVFHRRTGQDGVQLDAVRELRAVRWRAERPGLPVQEENLLQNHKRDRPRRGTACLLWRQIRQRSGWVLPVGHNGRWYLLRELANKII